MAADYYSDQSPDYGMPDMSNGSQGPTGIPDPNNPGFDTAGYPLSGGAPAVAAPITGGSWAPGTPQANGVTPTFTPAPGSNPTPITNNAGQVWGGGGPNGAFDTTGAPMSFAKATDTGGGLLDMFQGAAPAYTPAAVGPAPVFTPPGYTPPPAFKDPTLEEAQNEPGYRSAVDEGEKQVAASAAAKGVLNSGGTLKDIYAYGSNAATQNYQNVDNRARGNYLLNYQTQYTDPYAFAYKSAADAFAPKMVQYAAENNVNLANASGANTFDFNSWLQQYNMFRNRQLDTINANAATS